MGVIYGLFDPRTSTDLADCRYVGLTTDDPDDRLSGHINTAYAGVKRYVYNWIRSLFTEGLNPVMVVFQSPEESELDAAERSWVCAAKYAGARLTNGTQGGRVIPAEKLPPPITQAFRNIEDWLSYRNQRIKEGHAKIDKTPTMCDQCDAGPFVGALGVMRHATFKHRDHGETWCDLCDGGPFAGGLGLSSHKLHCGRNVEPTMCDLCDEGPFAGNSGVVAHRTHKHSDVKEPMICDECGAGPFAGRHGLSGHVRQAHGEYIDTWCDECKAGPFKGPGGLFVHQRYCGTKSDELCGECGAGPFAVGGLSSHFYRMHAPDGVEPLMCACGAGPFKGPIGLSGHKRQACPLA